MLLQEQRAPVASAPPGRDAGAMERGAPPPLASSQSAFPERIGRVKLDRLESVGSENAAKRALSPSGAKPFTPASEGVISVFQQQSLWQTASFLGPDGGSKGLPLTF